ncbi:hypothetical protein ACOME3_000913 [Neoechinorhynchus agilis]
MFAKKYEKVRNPQDHTNLLSRISFWYLNGFLYKSYKKGINESDVYSVRKKDAAKEVTKALDSRWKRESLKAKPRFSLALFKTLMFKYGLVLLIPYIEELCRLGQVITLGKLLRHFEINSSKGEAVGWALLLGLFSLIVGISHQFFFYEASAIGLRLRTACCNLIHEKMLKISCAARAETSSGYSVNMIGGDMNRIDFVAAFGLPVFIAPFQLILVSVFCSVVMGWTSLVGVLIFPLSYLITPILGYVYRKLRKQTAPLSDRRILYMNELLSGIQVVKMSGWEFPFQQIIETLRLKEIKKIFLTRAIESVSPSLSTPSVKVAIFLVITTYIAVNGKLPQPQIIYQIITAISPMRIFYIILLPLAGRLTAETLVAASRFQKFLNSEEISRVSIDKGSYVDNVELGENKGKIVLHNMTATWTTSGNSEDQFYLNEISLSAAKGSLTILCGRVGCGKSSVLGAIINEMSILEGNVSIGGTLSYCSQEPWLFNGTIRENILFGLGYDESRYKEVIKACNLDEDLDQLDNMDFFVKH